MLVAITVTMQVLIFVIFMKKRSHGITCCLVLMNCTLVLELHGVLVNSIIHREGEKISSRFITSIF